MLSPEGSDQQEKTKTQNTPAPSEKHTVSDHIKRLISRLTHLKNKGGASEAIRAIVEEPAPEEPFDQEAFDKKVAQLEAEYPGQVQLLPEGSILFHVSKDPARFVSENKFDTAAVTVPGTGIYLTDVSTEYTNISIALQRPAVFFDIKGDIMAGVHALNKHTDKEPKGLDAAAQDVGFDGTIVKHESSYSAFLPQGSTEYHIFNNAVDTIKGGISAYAKPKEESTASDVE